MSSYNNNDEQQHIRNAAVGSFGGRVGHKAGGFIAKKFFHPSNLKNQEKLWLKMEEKRKHEKEQEELMKRREEERRVELLREEMYRATGEGGSSNIISKQLKCGKPGLITTTQQGSSSGSMMNARPHDDASNDNQSTPEELAANETKKRLHSLNKEEKANEIDNNTNSEDYYDIRESRLVLNSRYKEDEFINGHTSVWGSYFNNNKWGYACCKICQRDAICPCKKDKINDDNNRKHNKRSRRSVGHK